jgi:hypothetical protein
MATNPNYPQQPRPELHRHDPQFQLQPKGKFPWPLVAIIVAVALLVAIIYYSRRLPNVSTAPTGASVPQQPFVSELKLINLQTGESPIGGTVYVTGQVKNSGTHAITEVAVDAAFQDSSGRVVQRETQRMAELVAPGSADAEPFTNKPIQPDQMRNFRIAFDNIPASWNHQVPELRIVHESYEGGGSAGVPAPTNTDAGGTYGNAGGNQGATSTTPPNPAKNSQPKQ